MIDCRDYRDRNGEECGDEYAAPPQIVCLDCLGTAKEIFMATGNWVYNSRNMREGNVPERAR